MPRALVFSFQEVYILNLLAIACNVDCVNNCAYNEAIDRLVFHDKIPRKQTLEIQHTFADALFTINLTP